MFGSCKQLSFKLILLLYLVRKDNTLTWNILLILSLITHMLSKALLSANIFLWWGCCRIHCYRTEKVHGLLNLLMFKILYQSHICTSERKNLQLIPLFNPSHRLVSQIQQNLTFTYNFVLPRRQRNSNDTKQISSGPLWEDKKNMKNVMSVDKLKQAFQCTCLV